MTTTGRAWLAGIAACLASVGLAGCGGGGDGGLVSSSSGAASSPTLAGRYRVVSTPVFGFVDASFRFAPDGTLAGSEAHGTFSGTWSPLLPSADRFHLTLTYVDAAAPGLPITSDYTVAMTQDDPPRLLLLGTLVELIETGPP